MRRSLPVVIVLLVVALFWWRHRRQTAPPATAAPAPARSSSASASASDPHASAPPSPPPGATVRRIDRDERAEMLRRLDTALHHAPSAPPSSPSPSPSPSPSSSSGPEQQLDKDYIAQQVRELMPLLSECYTNALRRDSKLAGKMVVSFSIVGDPSVGGLVGDSKIDAENSTIADDEMRQCVQETMYAAKFVPPKDSGEVHVTYPFVFSSSDDE